MHKLIVGCGYLGRRVAALWRERGETVYAITRSPVNAEKLRAAGILPIVADITRPESLRDLPEVETVLYAVAYDPAGGKTRREVHLEGLQSLLAAFPSSVRKIIFISTTGVYGQSGGEWVDEDSPCEPMGESGQVYLQTEEILRQDSRFGERAIILRLAGIYGPGRIPLAEKIRRGEPLPFSPDGFLNLIHVQDAARIVLAADEQLAPPRVLVVSDGEPIARVDYYAELARLLQAPSPQFVSPENADASTSPGRRGDSDKRINNARMSSSLEIVLKYPSYREGLAGIIAEDRELNG